MKKVITGNHAVSYAAKLSRAEVIAAYPITPQTEVVEKLSELVASGELKANFINVESEHSAMAACIGASATGARAFTATSSQGLALMHELLHWATGARLPIVMANINRSFGPPWNIWSDQTDSLAQRDTGWMQFYCENNQEILDTIIQAYRISEKVLLPAMVVLDAFYHSHTMEPVDIPDENSIDSFLAPYNPRYSLDVKRPRAFGGLTTPQWYYELRYKIERSMAQALEEIKKAGAAYGRLTGRTYSLIEKYRADDAKDIIIAAGALAETVKDAVDMLRENGKKTGLVRIRAFRPFPSEEIAAALKRAERVAVIDRNISFGCGGIFFQEVKSAVFARRKDTKIYGFIAGLGGRDVSDREIADVVYSMDKKAHTEKINWVGLKR